MCKVCCPPAEHLLLFASLICAAVCTNQGLSAGRAMTNAHACYAAGDSDLSEQSPTTSGHNATQLAAYKVWI